MSIFVNYFHSFDYFVHNYTKLLFFLILIFVAIVEHVIKAFTQTSEKKVQIMPDVTISLCREWDLSVAAGSKVQLTFTSFSLEAGPGVCPYDYVEISSGGESRKYCGAALPAPVTSEDNTMKVSFHTDSSVNDKGFSAEWKAV